MCFYCHKLYNFPYAPLHSHLNCPELAKINNYKIEQKNYHEKHSDNKNSNQTQIKSK